ncbi:hypothetical protein [Salsuginibacillus kocurii]|uniref:hypothetical protein n=1 Tax=Salsuginibacillus kocurii TaxID=427078 RepID=UPI00035D52EC|nr:hypothetical protein [Salsuginibacillus kocurii]
MLIIGFGKLGRLLADCYADSSKVPIYNRTKASIEAANRNTTRTFTYVPPEEFKHYSYVIVALPAEAYQPFFEAYGAYFQEGTVFFHTATSLMKEEAEERLGEQTVIPLKLAGHAEHIAQTELGTFVLDTKEDKMVKKLQAAFEKKLTFIKGAEEEVLTANRLATKHTLESIVELEQMLCEASVDQPIRESALTHIPSGVAYSYMNGSLGHFGKQLVDEIKKREASNGENR